MNKWISILVVALLTGCASAPEHEPEEESALEQEQILAPTEENRPALDEEVLYLLMAAELAGQRNQYYLALDAYLQAAKRVDDPRIAERAVKLGVYLKDEKRTREALQIWLAKDAGNLNARRFSLLLSIKNDDRQAAVDDMVLLLDADPAGFEGGLLEMAKLLEKEGRLRFTVEALEDLNQRRPDHAQVIFVQAVLASMLPDLNLAQRKIEQVLKLQPDWNKAIIFQAQLAGRSGDIEKARRYLERAVKQSPGDLPLKRMLVEVLINLGAYDEAARVCHAVLEEKPDDGESLFSLAVIQIQQNQLERAENTLEKLLNNRDWSDQASFFLGKIELQRRHAERALAWFDRVNGGRYAFDADLSAVTVLTGLKRMDAAETRLTEMEQKYPEQKTRVMLARAEWLNQAGRYPEAFDVLSEVLLQAPDNRDVLYARALVAEHMNKLDVMEADLRKILQSKPDDAPALNALGYTLADRTDRYAEAEQYLDQALKLQPNEAVIIDSYGWLQYKMGRPQLALEYLRKAYAKAAENEIAAHVAEVLWVSGNLKEAREVFDNAFKKAPEDTYLLNFKKRFLQNDEGQ